jgi:nucleotide-binding universal stress UspA family protein
MARQGREETGMDTLEITPRSEIRPLTSILVPLDGSDVSREALPYAAAFHVDRLMLLRVLGGEAPEEGGGPLDLFMSWRHERIEQAEADLHLLVGDNADSAGSVECEVRYGDAAEEIIAASADFDLVAMTSRGRGTVGRGVFGSVADRVVRYGTQPTLVTRVDDTPITEAFPTRVMVPLDGSTLAERALPLATRAAAMLDTSLHLVRVVGMDEILATVRRHRRDEPFDPAHYPDADPYEVAREATEREATGYLEAVAGRLRDAGYEVTTEMRGGTPTFELAWAAGSDDLVVMTSRGQGGYKRWRIGSVAEKLIRESEAPVVIVPVADEPASGA